MIPNTVHRDARRRTIASDELIAPCAQEGGTFRDPSPRFESTLAKVNAYERKRRREIAALWVCAGIVLFFFWIGSSHAASVCDWSNPGTDRFTGSTRAAVMHYEDIPTATRTRLADRVDRLDFDEVVTITASGITGQHAYGPRLTDMHYGSGRICSTVTRGELVGNHFGLAYTEDGYTVIVPNDCANVARGTRLPDEPAPPGRETAQGGPIEGAPVPAPPVSFLAPPGVPEPDAPSAAGYPVWLPAAGVAFAAIGACCCAPSLGVVPAVPEPSTWLLTVAAGLCVWLRVRVVRRRSARFEGQR